MHLEIVNKPYSSELAKVLIPALGDFSEAILSEIKRGESTIWEIGKTLYVVRIERDFQGLEMVIVAAVGSDIKQSAPRVVEQANNIGCYSIRFHSSRPGLVELLGLPFRETERVYRMNVGGE
ncbi:hypothetical protein ACQEXU_13215 [Vibrio sp. TRT 21S02]|uniref:hypothetical protein n=1 Tax=Vibrio sp. TRT 21S02 TaxID=3418507 RepID=UPI003CE7F77D